MKKLLLILFFCGAGAGHLWANDGDITFSTNTSATKFSIQNVSGVEVASVTSNGDAYFRSSVSPSSAYSYQITADSTTPAIAFGLTPLAFPVGANENWSFEFN